MQVRFEGYNGEMSGDLGLLTFIGFDFTRVMVAYSFPTKE